MIVKSTFQLLAEVVLKKKSSRNYNIIISEFNYKNMLIFFSLEK